MNKYFNGDGEYIYFWKSKGLSDENINSITASNYSITPKLRYLNAKIGVKFNGNRLKQDKINTYTHGIKINIYIVYKLILTINNFDPTLENCLFGTVKFTKNGDIDKYKYSGYSIGFDSKGSFSFADGSFGQNVIISRADMSSSAHVDKKKKKTF